VQHELRLHTHPASGFARLGQEYQDEQRVVHHIVRRRDAMVHLNLQWPVSMREERLSVNAPQPANLILSECSSSVPVLLAPQRVVKPGHE
jgi:hypothetical protein